MTDTECKPAEMSPDNSETDERGKGKKADANLRYNLRDSSIITRIKSERRRTVPKQPKPKSKPPPLSKYRRKSANSRERDRMKLMNDAFEDLKKVVPDYTCVSKSAKVTKMTTLRLAVNYIAALRSVLGYGDDQPGSPNDLDSVGDSGGSDGASESGSCRSPQSDPSSDGMEFTLGGDCAFSDIGQALDIELDDLEL